MVQFYEANFVGLVVATQDTVNVSNKVKKDNVFLSKQWNSYRLIFCESLIPFHTENVEMSA